MNVQTLFNGNGDGKERPDYDKIAEELKRLRTINNGFFSTDREKEQALADTGKLAAGLFNRAATLDGEDVDRWD